VRRSPHRVLVDDLAFDSFTLGGVGWVSGLANAFPAENCLLWDLLTAGRYEEAIEVYRWYTPLLHLDVHVKLVQYIKLACGECGFGSELVRTPRLPLIEPERSQVLSIILQAIHTRPTRVADLDSRMKTVSLHRPRHASTWQSAR